MNKLQKNLPSIVATLIGFLAIGAFYFFYSEQKEFSNNQKEFFLALDAIETNEAKLEYTLLQNYIYAYNNNDEITEALQMLEKSFERLESKILLNKDYTPPST